MELVMTRLRKGRGWSQSKLARKADLNQVTVSAIETGRLAPYPSQLAKLAKALDIDPSRAAELMEVTKEDD